MYSLPREWELKLDVASGEVMTMLGINLETAIEPDGR